MIDVGGISFESSKTENIIQKKSNFSNSAMCLPDYELNSKRKWDNETLVI